LGDIVVGGRDGGASISRVEEDVDGSVEGDIPKGGGEDTIVTVRSQRMPQSIQSVPIWHPLNSAPTPPSSQ